MSGSLYELCAIAARYLFAALMVLIVARAWKITLVDARRAATLRRMSPETGICGEFLILTGSGKVREGMRFPVIREGMIGSSAKSDVRLRANGVHCTHSYFQLTPEGLHIRDHASARIFNARGETKREMYLGDGAKITVGSVEMMLILTVAVNAPAENTEKDIFDIPDDSPVLRTRPVPPRPVRPAPPVPENIPISRETPDNVYIPRASYTRDAESQYKWRETVIDETTSRRTVVRETETDDLFMENPLAARQVEPAPDSIPGWDDPWSAPVKKPVITKKPVDDPFDI